MRHTGMNKETGARYALLFLENPEQKGTTLVIESDALPAMYHDALMRIIESAPAQQSPNLADVLHREVFPDGKSVLTTLHQTGKIKKMSIHDIVVTPTPYQKLPLSDVINAINGNPTNVDKFNPHLNNINANSLEDREKIANGIMRQAEILKYDLTKKIAEASQYSERIVDIHLKKMGLRKQDFKLAEGQSAETPFTSNTPSDQITNVVNQKVHKDETSNMKFEGIDPEMIKEALRKIADEKSKEVKKSIKSTKTKK